MLNINKHLVNLFVVLPLGFLMSLALVSLIRKVSTKFQVFPKVNFRRRTNEIPLLGGVAIYVTFISLALIVGSKESLYLATAALPLFVAGVLDDVVEFSAKIKFALQNLSFVLFFVLFHDQPMFLHHFSVTGPIFYFISMCWFIGTTNSFNLLDGTDGQTSTIALCICAGLGFVGGQPDNTSLILFFSTLGFLAFNFPPAKIYLGDAGSNFLGFVLAAKAMLVNPTNSSLAYPLAMLFIFSLPLTDTVTAIFRRKKNNRGIMEGDQDHIHHKLLKIGLNKRQTLFITSFMTVSGVLTGVLVFKSTEISTQLLMMFTSGSLLTFVFFGILYTQKHLGKRTSDIGSTLIKKHLNVENMEYVEIPIQTIKKAVLFDLLPYYTELQLEGLLVIDSFVQEITELALKHQNRENIYTVGSYSILLAFHKSNSWMPLETTQISNDLYNLFDKYKITKNDSNVPEGITFYDEKSIHKLASLIKPRLINRRKVA
jgi:UDP-GlcNAc:undecaprenyl-phosphate GlcNAc-1-phosphate transferase